MEKILNRLDDIEMILSQIQVLLKDDLELSGKLDGVANTVFNFRLDVWEAYKAGKEDF